MTEFLIRRFVPDPDNTADPAVRTAYGNLASITGILCNLLLALGKLAAGLVFGSIAIVADALNNFSDASSSVISLLGFKLASKPADDDHPYGHARYEYLAGLAVAVMVLLIGVELAQSSVGKILDPTPVAFSLVTVGVLAGSILGKLWLAAFNRTVGGRIRSATLIAAAADSRNDVISTSAVLAAMVLSHLTHLELDGWMGLGVAVFILYSGVTLVRDTLDPLLGAAPDAALTQHIHDRVMAAPGVLGVHDLIVHDYGPGRQFASLHVEMTAEADVLESHDVIDNIERAFWEEDRLHVVIHYDPIVTGDEAVSDLRAWLGREVKTIDPVLSVHDLRIVPGRTHTNLIFDCVTPPDFAMSDLEVKQAIKRLVQQRDPSYFCVINMEHSFAAIPHEN